MLILAIFHQFLHKPPYFYQVRQGRIEKIRRLFFQKIKSSGAARTQPAGCEAKASQTG